MEAKYVYIWLEVEKCSDYHHTGGAVIAVDESVPRARESANQTPGCCIFEHEMPDVVIPCDPTTPNQIHIIPDAGCC